MKQLPISFNREMVKAIKSDSKTETRRTKGLETVNKDPDNWECYFLSDEIDSGFLALFRNKLNLAANCRIQFPYGTVGDILLVAEIWLEITDIKVERLQDISDKSAINEGIEQLAPWPEAPDYPRYRFYGVEHNPNNGDASVFDPTVSFFTLWAQIYGQGAVVQNPWVWVITFKQIEKP